MSYTPKIDCKATPEAITAACAELADQIREGREYITLPLSAHAVLTRGKSEGASLYVQIERVEYRIRLYADSAKGIEAELKRILK
jgi:hypothetical protein